MAHTCEIREHDQVVVVENLGTYGYAHGDAVATGAEAHLAHAVATGFGLEMLLVAKIDQCIQAVDSFHDDIAAATAITTVGTAIFDMRFAPEAYAARAAITTFDEYFCGIKKLHDPVIRFAKIQTRLSPVRQNEA